ncbi:MAG: hypothetical protein B7X08_02230 [Acidocella sp. 20-63-7]|nr:MAG: hypothetical protein B7X08_02230 [Acidocella sp. 20-63-7]HQT46882.1 DUF1778 domain-containing protein [Acidocella sp.]
MANIGSKPKSTRLRAERLELRITAPQKALIGHAAALQGRSITDFVLASVQDAAARVIDDQQRLTLSVNDGRAFVEALVSPVPLGGELAEALRNLKT